MYRIVVLLVLCLHALSQPVTDEPSTRLARQVTECCPCPGSSNGGQDMPVGSGQLTRADDPDDCPCRPRSADSEGASSFLIPSAVRQDGPLVRQNDYKEDSRNLLEPEVTLATSMLDTLREATDEGYRDALARDAAKSATDPDALPEESARNVVFIVKPRDSDEFVSEASHVQESGCIHPLETTLLGEMRNPTKPNNLLRDTLTFSKLKHSGILNRKSLQMDNDVGASNVKEKTIENNENTPLQSTTPTLEIKDPFKRIKNAHNLRNSNIKPGIINGHELTFPKGLKFPLLPKLKQNTKMFSNDNLSPNNMQEQSEVADDSNNQLFRHSKLPLNMTRLLKLKDVELVPKSILNKNLSKPKLDMSKLAMPTVLKRNSNGNNFEDNCENIKNDENPESTWNKQKTKIDALRKVIRPLDHKEDYSSSELDQFSDNDSETKLSEENLDTMMSPSQMQLSSAVDGHNKKEYGKISQYTIKHDHDYTFSEPRELTDGNQIKENQDEFKKIVYDSEKPKIISVSEKETSNKNYDQDVTVGDLLQEQVLNLNKDLETDSSNAQNLVYLKSPEKRVTDILPQNQENNNKDEECTGNQEINNFQIVDEEIIESKIKTPENKNMDPRLKAFSEPLGKTFPNLQENIVRNYNKFKTASIGNSELIKMSHDGDHLSVSNESEENIDDVSQNYQFKNDEGNKLMTNFRPTDIATSDNKVTINDLQNMSDNLLSPSTSIKTAECNINPNEINLKSMDREIDKKNLDTNLEPNDAKKEISYYKENSCSTITENNNMQENQEQTLKSASQEIEPKEMDTGASDTIITTLPSALDPFNFNSKLRSPLFESIGVHAPQDALSLLKKPLGDVLNLNTNLPTLEDLRERLTNIFNTNDRSAEDDSSSFESDFTNVYPKEMMTPEASTTNSRIKLPHLRQLNDYNEEVFRTRPITVSSIETLTPRLSYLPKIPVPSKLRVKPVNFESRLGPARKIKPNNSELRLGIFPSLGDLRHNSKDLLSSSSRPDLNLFTSNLRPNDIEDIAETIRLNMQNTMKSLRQKMKSTLRKTKTYNQIGEPLAKPKELLDDMNDKLKGIHYDLNDRISSIRDNIMDSPQIKTLVSESHKLANKNDLIELTTNLRQRQAKPPPSRLQKASKQRDFIPNIEPRRLINTPWDKPNIKQVAAESSPTPVRIEMPKSESLSYLQKPTLLRQNPTVTEFLQERKPFSALIREPTNFRNGNIPVFKTSSPFKKQPKRVTISFEPTTYRPFPSPRPILTPRGPTKASPPFEENDENMFSGLNSKFATERDLVYPISAEETEASPSEFKSLRGSAVMPSYDKKLENYSKEKYPMTNISRRPSVLKEMGNSKIKGNKNNYKSANIFDESEERIIPSASSRSSEEPSAWPKVYEKAFLSNVRDSVNMRTSNRNLKPNGDGKTEHEIKSDMLKSASENTHVILNEPLKENVSYKCRMVCTKVSN